MKKVLSITLATVMIFSSAVSFSAAAVKIPPGLAKKGGLPPGIVKKFIDIDGYEWAWEAIEKMAEKEVIKGIGNGLFAPQRSVTKLEAVVMALRVMGEETKANVYRDEIKIGKRTFKLKDKIQEWAYGFVKLAEEKGILEEYELVDFNLNQEAKRHEVAKYMLRAAGYKEEAERYMDKELGFIDALEIPLGSVGYVYLAEKMGLIKGYEDNSFRPNKPVTRAEMAVMIARLDEKIKEGDFKYKSYRGKVTDIDLDGKSKTIEIDDDEVFVITSDTKVVFDGDKKGSIKDIEVGDKVKITANSKMEGIEIIVERKLAEINYKGSIVDIEEYGDEYEISIYGNKKFYDFLLDEDFPVEFKDGKGTVEDLRIGDEVTVYLDGDKEVLRIKVNRDLEEDLLEGTISKILEKERQILIKSGKTYKIYKLDEDVKIYLNGERARLSDLKEDDSIKFEVDDDDEITLIKGYRVILE